jgi:hypothetical protein
MTWLRLSYRRQSWEAFLIVAASIAVAGGMVYISGQIEELRILRDACLAETPGQCDAIVGRAYDPTQTAQLLLSMSEIAPFVIGITLGAPLVAREIEGRTAYFGWTMSRSRTRWLIGRAVFGIALGAMCLALIAWTSEMAAALLDPERSLARDFNFAESRGPILVARGFAVLALAVLAGAVVGRLLPGLLAAILVVAGVFLGFGFADAAVLKAEARVVRTDPETGTGSLGDHWVDSGLQLTDGPAVSWDEVSRRGIRGQDAASQTAFTQDANGCWYSSEAEISAGRPVGCEVAWVVSGDRYPEVTARRAAMLGGIGLLALAGAAVVVERRRPE